MKIRKVWQMRVHSGTVMLVRRQDTWAGDSAHELEPVAEELDRWVGHPVTRSGLGELYPTLAAHTAGLRRPGDSGEGDEDDRGDADGRGDGGHGSPEARLEAAFRQAGVNLVHGPQGKYWEPMVGGIASGTPGAGTGSGGATAAGAAVAEPPPAAAASGAAPASGAPSAAPPKTWIEIQLVDKQRRPVRGRSFAVKLPDGSTRTGTLDDNGFALLDGLDPGSCQVSFPEMDGHEWSKL